jgi:hypothetical protein
MLGIKKFFKGLGLVPKTSSEANAKGELEVLDGDGKLRYHNGTSVSPVVTEAHSATLTNKTIDADQNTITNIENADIKAAAGIVESKLSLDYSTSSLNSAIQNHINDTTDAHDASAISYDNTSSNLTATDVQAAIDEVESRLDTAETNITTNASNLTNHLNDTTDAHDASAISNVPAGTISSTDVQAAINELDGDIQAHINDTSDAHDASAISNVPAGTISATDVQAAINELDGDIQGHVTATQNVHGIGAGNSVVGTGTTQTLTNKTIDGDDNTIQDLALTSLKTDVANANKVIRRNASGVVISGNDLPNSSVIVTTDASQVITNKDIDGGTASNSNRITLPKNTRTNLDSLTRKQGTVLYDTTSNKVLYDDGSNLKELGSGGGELNFLQLSNVSWDAESGAIGFATYKDAAQSRPVDGTGGTASVTVTTSNTNPLSGNSSLIITKPSGNLQGEGVSVNFAIDRASRARVLKIEFDYLVNSGTFNAGSNTADSDLIVYLYDVDAAQLIEPSSFKLFSNSSSITDKFSGYFQTSASSTNYRLIFHVATTNSSSWSLKVDNVVVTPSKYVYGTPITGWVEYTPQFKATVTDPTIGPNGSIKGRWRRVGDSIEVVAVAARGNSGGSVGNGYYYLTLPQGLTVDSSKQPDTGLSGIGYVFDGGVANYTGACNTISSNGLSIVLHNTGDSVTHNVPSANWWTSSGEQFFVVNAKVPIQGWSSSVKMSDGYEGREIASHYNTNVGGTLVDNAFTFIDFHNKVYDSTNSVVGAGNGHNTNWQNTWRYIVPSSGRYAIKANVQVNLPSTPAVALIRAYKNGQELFRGSRLYYTAPNNEFRGLVVAGDADLKAGDAISVAVYQTSGGNRSLETDFPSNTISIHRISSPQAIAMGEVLAGHAKNASGQVIPHNTATTLTSWTTVTDTHAIFNPSTGVLTVNRSGFIDLSAIVSFSPNSTGDRSILFVFNNTTEIGIVDIRAVSGSITTGVSTSISCYPVKSGDTFIVRTFQTSGGNLAIFSDRTILSWRIY